MQWTHYKKSEVAIAPWTVDQYQMPKADPQLLCSLLCSIEYPKIDYRRAGRIRLVFSSKWSKIFWWESHMTKFVHRNFLVPPSVYQTPLIPTRFPPPTTWWFLPVLWSQKRGGIGQPSDFQGLGFQTASHRPWEGGALWPLAGLPSSGKPRFASESLWASQPWTRRQ